MAIDNTLYILLCLPFRRITYSASFCFVFKPLTLDILLIYYCSSLDSDVGRKRAMCPDMGLKRMLIVLKLQTDWKRFCISAQMVGKRRRTMKMKRRDEVGRDGNGWVRLVYSFISPLSSHSMFLRVIHVIFIPFLSFKRTFRKFMPRLHFQPILLHPFLWFRSELFPSFRRLNHVYKMLTFSFFSFNCCCFWRRKGSVKSETSSSIRSLSKQSTSSPREESWKDGRRRKRNWKKRKILILRIELVPDIAKWKVALRKETLEEAEKEEEIWGMRWWETGIVLSFTTRFIWNRISNWNGHRCIKSMSASCSILPTWYVRSLL